MDLSTENVSVVDSASWYHKTFSAAGNWESWIWESVNGRDFGTRKEHFAGFVVCEPTLGRANASIVRLALRGKRTVLHWVESAPLRLVTEVIELDGNDWKTGWGVQSHDLS
jgi:hypothetical protein